MPKQRFCSVSAPGAVDDRRLSGALARGFNPRYCRHGRLPEGCGANPGETVRSTRGVRGLLVHNEHSVSERLRRRRWRVVERLLPDLADLRVLDLGGTGSFWAAAPVRPAHVTAINLHEAALGDPSVRTIEGDALRAPELVAGETFDLVFSNSLIEHLGGHGPRSQFAAVVVSMAPRYVVQTPYRYFPVEPHWIFPGFQFLPVLARSYIAPRWPLGHTHGWEPRAATEEVLKTHLLSETELHHYFPSATIVREDLLGIPKSMFAVFPRIPHRPGDRAPA